MAAHKKAVALLIVITYILSCYARPLQPSILSPMPKRQNGGGGRLQIAVQPNDVAEIKGRHKRIMRMEVELDDVMKNCTNLEWIKKPHLPSAPSPIQNPTDVVLDEHKQSGSFQRSEESKGDVVPSGPSPIHNSNRFSSKHKQSQSFQRSAESNVRLDGEEDFSRPVFNKLPKGPIAPSGPSPIHHSDIFSSKHKPSQNLKRSAESKVRLEGEEYFSRPVFSKLPKGPVAPSGPSPIHDSDTFSNRHKPSQNLKRSAESKVRLDGEEDFSRPVFSKLAKGPVAPSGPSPIHDSNTFSIKHTPSKSLQRSAESKVRLDGEEDFSTPAFSKLPKGPIAPSGPSPIHDSNTFSSKHKPGQSVQSQN